MIDKLVAPLWFLALCAFLVLTIVYIREFDLFLVVAIVLAFAGYDFWKMISSSNSEKTSGS